jgi:hypothetical protein
VPRCARTSPAVTAAPSARTTTRGRMGRTSADGTGSMHGRAGQVIVVDFEVRDLEATDGIDRHGKRLFGCLRPSRLPQALLGLAKRPQHLCPIETLSLAVFAEAH